MQDLSLLQEVTYGAVSRLLSESLRNDRRNLKQGTKTPKGFQYLHNKVIWYPRVITYVAMQDFIYFFSVSKHWVLR